MNWFLSEFIKSSITKNDLISRKAILDKLNQL